MTNSNALKAERLQMPIGTASNRLKKTILLRLLQRLDEDLCFRCSERIETVEQLSIEHKEAWLYAPDPVGSFFDLDNIAFSHLSCNCSASKGRPNVTHCPRGHEYTEANMRTDNGSRHCKACHKITNRNWKRNSKTASMRVEEVHSQVS